MTIKNYDLNCLPILCTLNCDGVYVVGCYGFSLSNYSLTRLSVVSVGIVYPSPSRRSLGAVRFPHYFSKPVTQI